MGINSTSYKMNRQIFSPFVLILLIPILGIILTSEWFERRQLLSDLKDLSKIQNDVRAEREALDSVRFIFLSPTGSQPRRIPASPQSGGAHAGVPGVPDTSTNSDLPNLDNLDKLRQYYASIPKEDQVVVYWPLSPYHKAKKTTGKTLMLGKAKVDYNTITSKDTTEISHFRELTRILYSAKSNTPLNPGVGRPNTCFLLICTRNIIPTGGHPPVYDLFKSVTIDNKTYDVVMEIRSGDGLSYLVIEYDIDSLHEENKVVRIEKKKSTSVQKANFKISDLLNGAYLLYVD